MDHRSEQAINAAAIRAEEGQGLVEYGLVVVLISIIAIGILTTIGGQITALFASVSAVV